MLVCLSKMDLQNGSTGNYATSKRNKILDVQLIKRPNPDTENVEENVGK